MRKLYSEEQLNSIINEKLGTVDFANEIDVEDISYTVEEGKYYVINDTTSSHLFTVPAGVRNFVIRATSLGTECTYTVRFSKNVGYSHIDIENTVPDLSCGKAIEFSYELTTGNYWFECINEVVSIKTKNTTE